VKEVYATSDGRLLMRGRLQSVRRARCSVGPLAPVESVSESVYCRESAVRLWSVWSSTCLRWSPHPPCLPAPPAVSVCPVQTAVPCCPQPSRYPRRRLPSIVTHSGAARGGGGKLPAYGWTSKNYVICVCFRCHGTSSYHTTDTLQGRRAKSHFDTQTIQPGLGDFVL